MPMCQINEATIEEALLPVVGKRVKHFREQHQWTPADLASRMGLSEGTVGRLERGESKLPLGRLIHLALVFHQPLEELGVTIPALECDYIH